MAIKEKILLLLFLFLGLLSQAQEIPSIYANGYSFPLGSKFTIKLHAVDSVNFNFSVIAFEQYTQTLATASKKN